MTRWLRFSGSPAPATIQDPATQTEPSQVSGLSVAQIQCHRTSETEYATQSAADVVHEGFGQLASRRLKIRLVEGDQGGDVDD
jgi:hypothetical protein